MTYRQIQEKMNGVFEAIGRVSTELVKTSENLQKLQEEEKKYSEAVNDSTDAYNLVKNRDMIHLMTFKAAKNNKEDVAKIYENVKVKVFMAKTQCDILKRDLEIYKDKYAELEDLYQNHDNTLRFYDVKKDQNKPN